MSFVETIERARALDPRDLIDAKALLAELA